jgi:5-methylcytosine-specific restriction endonuclease McrA
MNKTPRIPIPPEVKKYVWQRDKYQCRSCGKTATETNLTIDHIIPLARGGASPAISKKPIGLIPGLDAILIYSNMQ